nr:hypothetical transcript [Hymenolepis microstoma]
MQALLGEKMTSEVTVDVVKRKIEEELSQFNIDQVNNFIKFYNLYGHRLYLMEKGVEVDKCSNQTTEQVPEGRLICESMEEIEYIRNQFQKLCEANMKMLKDHIEKTKPSSSMIALMKILMELGRKEQRIEMEKVEFL